jgi:hypothetical protein
MHIKVDQSKIRTGYLTPRSVGEPLGDYGRKALNYPFASWANGLLIEQV